MKKKLHYSKDIKRKMAGRKSPAFKITKEQMHDAGTFLVLLWWMGSFLTALAVYIGLL